MTVVDRRWPHLLRQGWGRIRAVVGSSRCDRLVLAVVSAGGAGYLPWAPGTMGALVGTAVACLTEINPVLQGALVVACLLAGLLLIPIAQRLFGTDDPRQVVIDEVCGALVTFIGLPLTPLVIITGFFTFRLLDILKPGPIRRLERLPGGWGVMADDLAAGLLAHGVAWWVGLRL